MKHLQFIAIISLWCSRKMILRTLMLVALILAFSAHVKAQLFVYDKFCFSVNADKNSVTLCWAVSGDESNFYNDYRQDRGVTEVSIPDKAVWKERGRKDKTFTVTAIARMAFQDCTKLTTVTIPGTVKTIGQCAFKGCNNLSSITNYAMVPQKSDMGRTVDEDGVFGFVDTEKVKLIVPRGSFYGQEDYGWKNFIIEQRELQDNSSLKN